MEKVGASPPPDLPSPHAQDQDGENQQRPELKRINVAVNAETVRALQALMEREGSTLTEAVRRLIGYGDYVYRAVRERGEDLVVRGQDGSTRDIVIL